MHVVRTLTAFYVLAVILVSSAVINLLQLLARASIFLSYSTRLSISQRLANLWWDLFRYAFEVWGGIPFHFSGDDLRHPQRAKQNAILIGNHCPTGLDFVIGVTVASIVPDIGCGRMMAMMKSSLQFLPTVGLTNLLQGSLFLKRNWEKDQKALLRKFRHMEDGTFPRPFWFGVYPEGTRITPAKHAASVKFAKERGLPQLQNVLLPRVKGFCFLKKNLPSSISHIHDCTIVYETRPALLKDVLFHGNFGCTAVHVNVRDIPFEEVPSSDEDVKSWLMSVFERKDKLITHFKEHGNYGDDVKTVTYPSDNGRLTRLFVAWALVLTALAYVAFASTTPAIVSVVMAALSLVIRPTPGAGYKKTQRPAPATSNTAPTKASSSQVRRRSKSRKADTDYDTLLRGMRTRMGRSPAVVGTPKVERTAPPSSFATPVRKTPTAKATPRRTTPAKRMRNRESRMGRGLDKLTSLADQLEAALRQEAEL